MRQGETGGAQEGEEGGDAHLDREELGHEGSAGVARCRRLVVLDGGGAPLLLGSSEATRRKQARGRGLDPSWIGRRLAAGEIERGGWPRELED